jgi:hypothetical protein
MTLPQFHSPESADLADEEVAGLERLAPTRLAKATLLAIVLAPFALFQFVRANTSWFSLAHLSPTEQTLVSLVAAMALACLLLVALAIELSLVVWQHKHRRIVHYIAQHPSLAPRFLWHNTRASTKLIACLCLILVFALGFNLCAP